jgi:hypothetical protein
LSDRYVDFNINLTGPDHVRYEAGVTFGDDSTEERRTLYSPDRLSLPHLYARNGTYSLEVIARNAETSDRLSCSRTVVFDDCVRAFEEKDDLTFDGRWRRAAVTDGPGIGETSSWLQSGGNPGGYQRMTHEFTATTAPAFVSIFVYHVFEGFQPAPGPIDHITYREDRIKLAPLTATSAVGGGALIVQNGVNHVAPLTGGTFANSSSWETVDVTLRASDFTPVPDFSASAAPMAFGYYRSNSNRFPLVVEHGIDNWRIQICR